MCSQCFKWVCSAHVVTPMYLKAWNSKFWCLTLPINFSDVSECTSNMACIKSYLLANSIRTNLWHQNPNVGSQSCIVEKTKQSCHICCKQYQTDWFLKKLTVRRWFFPAKITSGWYWRHLWLNDRPVPKCSRVIQAFTNTQIKAVVINMACK